MKLFLLTSFLTLLVLVRSNPVERKNVVICEFFKNIEIFHAEQWEDAVNLFKTMLRQTITAASAYPEYRNYTAFMQDYLDRGKSIDQSTSVEKKKEYFEGFPEYEDKPSLDLTTEKGRELAGFVSSFRTGLMSVLSKFYTKYTKAGQDMFRTLDAMNVIFSDDLFMLLLKYPPEYMGPGVETLGFQILAFKNKYPCV